MSVSCAVGCARATSIQLSARRLDLFIRFPLAEQFALRLLHLLRLRLLLELHAPILEPNFDLPFGELQTVRDLDAPTPSKVFVIAELFLQFKRLVSSVRLAASLAFTCYPMWVVGR